MRKDVFICHAGEDKTPVIRPLACCLEDRGISYWLDEAEISLGESITEKVNEGLKISDFVVVVLSRAFMSKHWPKRELWSVLNLEAKSGKVILLPILVGTQSEVDGLVNEFPLLNDKLFLLWNGDANRVANAIQTTVYKSRGTQQPKAVDMHSCGHCQTPFQHGVHVCLGCQGRIIYGLTAQEKLNTRQGTAAVLFLIVWLSMVQLPLYTMSWFGFQFPMMWGLGFWSVPLGAILIFSGAFFAEFQNTKKKAHLIRTLR
ncbi:MAG: toll/interleukin-1 receptor domain-containing protein [Methylobacter sp.]|nr:toll/interleukin-1 receptor domain-containing protein [Methylobacter sp.]